MNRNELIARTKKFAHNCVKLAASLPSTSIDNHVRNQLNRCSTSVAANYRATCLAQSKAAFIAKISIVLEECDESFFWLEFIKDEKLSVFPLDELLKESEELTKIFGRSRLTAIGKKEITQTDSSIFNLKSSI